MRYPSFKPKEKSLNIHSKRRAMERFGVMFTSTDLEQLANLYRSKKYCCHLPADTLRVRRGIVYYKDTWYPVVYDKQRKCIVTILTMDMLDDVDKYKFEVHLKHWGFEDQNNLCNS